MRPVTLSGLILPACLLSLLTSHSFAGDIEPYKAHEIQPYSAKTTTVQKAKEIAPHKAKTMSRSRKANDIEVYHAQEVQPAEKTDDVRLYHASRVHHRRSKNVQQEETETSGKSISAAPSSDRHTAPVTSKPTTAKTAAMKASAASFLGSWAGRSYALGWGYTTTGTLEIRADGTYTYNNGSGRYKSEGNRISFITGPLTAWDNGRASLTEHNSIDFYWKTPNGAQQWFTFVK